MPNEIMNINDVFDPEEDEENNNTLNFIHDPNVSVLPSEVQNVPMENQESPFKKKTTVASNLSGMKRLNLESNEKEKSAYQ